MFEAESFRPLDPILSGSAPMPKTVYLSQFFELLELNFQRENKQLVKLFPNQEEAFPIALKGDSLAIGAGGGEGKTYDAYACLHRCLTQGLIGVYLVPTKRLLQQKAEGIEKFFSLSPDGQSQNLAHVITISGERRPNKIDLRKFQKNLIIVATYEAFRAFYFSVQHRQYFRHQQCFGTIVVDEAHMLGDRTRGMSLHTLLLKLHEEQDPQFCLLSASVAREDAEWWSTRLGAHLLYYESDRTYPCKIMLVEEGEKKLSKLCDEIREVVVESVEELSEEDSIVATIGDGDTLEGRTTTKDEKTSRNKFTYHPGRVLVFCSTRPLAESVVQEIWKQDWCGEYNPACWCEMIHAGLKEEDQKDVFDIFRQQTGTQILVSSPLLEAGIDIPEIKLVVVVDSEHYNAIRLNQICARLIRGFQRKNGKKDEGVPPKIVLLTEERFKDQLLQKIEVNIDASEITAFNLKYLYEDFPEVDYPRLILEQLLRHYRTEVGLRDRLEQLSRHPDYADQRRGDFRGDLKALINRGDLREQRYEVNQAIFRHIFWYRESDESLLAQLLLLGAPLPGTEGDAEDDTKKQFKAVFRGKFKRDQIAEGRELILRHIFWENRSAQELRDQVPLSSESSSFLSLFPQKDPKEQLFHLIKQLDVKGWLEDLIKAANLKGQLNRLLRYEFVRKVGSEYALTFLGETVVETGIDIETAIQCMEFIKGIKRRPGFKRLSFPRSIDVFLAILVAERSVLDIPELDKRAIRKEAIIRFLMHYDAALPGENWKYRQVFGILGYTYIPPGDEETLRRTALWLAVSLMALYRSYLLQQAPLKPEAHSYYERIFPQKRSADEQNIVRRLRRLIGSFQLSDAAEHVRFQRKPEPRPHKGYYRQTQYATLLELLLRYAGREGATIQELQVKLRSDAVILQLFMLIPLLKKKLPPILKPSTIYSTLNTTLATKIYKEERRFGQPYRPYFRYWLTQFKRRPLKKVWCRDCKYFRKRKKPIPSDPRRKTHCKQELACETGWTTPEPPCPHFQRRKQKDKFLIYYPRNFQVAGEEKVYCPYCGAYNTIRVPTFQKLSLCRNCHILMKQVGQGRYYARTGVLLKHLKWRIEDKNGRPYINFFKYKRKIHLKVGESLSVEDPETTGIAMVYIQGQEGPGPFRSKSDVLFLDEIEEIHLEGGIIRAGWEVLEDHEIHPQEYSEQEVLQKMRRGEQAAELRQALAELPGNISLQKGIEAVIAKTLSNISYTFLLGSLNPEQYLEFIFRQFDQITQLYLRIGVLGRDSNLTQQYSEALLESKRRVQSREGIADNAAYDTIRLILPDKYQFQSRKMGRAAPSDFYFGAKSLDPFNCALNYLFYLLRQEVRAALDAAGFHKYYPGVGFLHHRHRKPPAIEHATNTGFIYDFIDPYRAPFRYFLLLACYEEKELLKKRLMLASSPSVNWCFNEQNRFVAADFKTPINESHLIYKLSDQGKTKLKELFKLICAEQFSYKGKTQTLQQIMQREAAEFAQFLLKRTRESFGEQDHQIVPPFLKEFFEPFIRAQSHQAFSFLANSRISQFYRLLKWILNSHHKKSPLITERRITEPKVHDIFPPPLKPKASQPLHNIIILTHGDIDGFLSALQLLIQYYAWTDPHRGTVQILTATPETHENVLEKRIPSLLWRDRNTQNTIIVADLAIPGDYDFFRKLYNKYLRILRARPEQLELIWYDHHPLDPSMNLRQLQEDFHFTCHYDPSAPSTSALIYRYLQIDFEARISKGSSNDIYETTSQQLYQNLNLSESQWLKWGKKSDFLDQWARFFMAINAKKRKLRHQTWCNFFLDVLAEKKPPEVPLAKDLVTKKVKKLLRYLKLQKTGDGVPFLAVIPWVPHNIEDLKTYLLERLKILPKFIVYYSLYDFSVIMRAPEKSKLDFSALASDQRVIGLPRALRIKRPFRPVYQAGAVTLCRPMSASEVFNWLGTKAVARKSSEVATFAVSGLRPSPPLPSDRESKPKDPNQFARYCADFPQKRRVLTLVPSEGDNLEFLSGRLYLLFGKKTTEGKTALHQFIQYLCHQYLTQNPLDRKPGYEILFIGTKLSSFSKVFQTSLFELCRWGLHHFLVSKICYIPAIDYLDLNTFIRTYLLSTIKTTGVRLVILSDPFTLSYYYSVNQRKDEKPYVFMSEKGGKLMSMLREVATETGVRIFITTERGLYKNTSRADLPFTIRQSNCIQIYVAAGEQGIQLGIEQQRYAGRFTLPSPLTDPKALSELCELPSAIDSTLLLPSSRPSRRSVKSSKVLLPEAEGDEEAELKDEDEEKEKETERKELEESEESLTAGFAKLEKMPLVKETFYGMKFLPWCFQEDPEDIFPLLSKATVDHEFDLVKRADGSIRIYNSKIDLREAITLQKLGGKSKLEGSFAGASMWFNISSQKLHDYEEFEDYIMTHFLTLDQLESFLKDFTKTFLTNLVEKVETKPPSEEDVKIGIESVIPKFLTLFETFPPELPPDDLIALWQAILNDLHAIFPASKIKHLISNIFGDMLFVDLKEIDLKEIEKDIRKNLK